MKGGVQQTKEQRRDPSSKIHRFEDGQKEPELLRKFKTLRMRSLNARWPQGSSES